ncbi:MAG: hypothetical protein GKR93_06100 [Gammaproteobacteria bacterium]|nr:hypothetical protein [Gammaproteobacteria bacterium]
MNKELAPFLLANTDIRRFALVFLILLANACSTNSGKVLAPVPVEDRSVGRSEHGQVTDTVKRTEADKESNTDSVSTFENNSLDTKSEKPVVTALLDEVNTSLRDNDDVAAAAGLERALRLDAKNALLWHRLGQIRLRQKNWQQSLNLAKKSNSLAAGDYALQLKNWELIYLANSAAGNHDDARLAAERVRRLKRKLQDQSFLQEIE